MMISTIAILFAIVFFNVIGITITYKGKAAGCVTFVVSILAVCQSVPHLSVYNSSLYGSDVVTVYAYSSESGTTVV